jgi:hypothetical protein|tara:strand:+ start:1323 stop:1520 length:198 start_codon:yes stop_codon:yes gene_type:complete
MKFRELREYYEADDDKFNTAKIDDTRKNRLTLNHLNKLRKKRELERLEKQERVNDLGQIYGKPAE